MTSRNIFLIIIICIAQFAFCQNEKWIHGKITVKDGSPQGVHIINLVNEKETLSDAKGEFNIEAKTDDLLVFSSKHLDYQRKIIEEDDYKSGSIIIEMTSKITQLDEVRIIKYPEFDAVKMGILSAPPKKYTPAQRRLYTASSGPVDLILNTFSGRKMLKKEILVERDESLLLILTELYSDEYYIKELNIDPNLIKGFQYYAIQDKNMAKALRSKNKAMISFIAVQLAFEYNNLQRANKL